jgi:hypothetical protein
VLDGYPDGSTRQLSWPDGGCHWSRACLLLTAPPYVK